MYHLLIKKIIIIYVQMVNKDIILVTGCAGFIGYHLCKNLLKKI